MVYLLPFYRSRPEALTAHMGWQGYLFVHASALNRAGIADLAKDQRVAVDVIDGRKGPEAAGLRLT